MRGFSKAAALLSLSRALSLVIPDANTLPARPVVDYQPRDALVKFDISSETPNEQYPPFTFQVKATSKPCGESHVLLNGLKLDAEWDGVTAHGSGYLDLYGGKEAEWDIRCLYDTVPADGGNSHGEDVVHLLSLRVGPSISTVAPGFTVSYKQMAQLAIVRFKPRYESPDLFSRPGFANRWRTPSLEFDPEVLDNVQKETSTPALGLLGQGQKRLGSYLQSLKGSIKKEVSEVLNYFCPVHKSKTGNFKPSLPFHLPSDKLLQPPPSHNNPSTTTTETSGITNTIPNLSAAETRSLAVPEAIDPSTTHTSTHSISTQSHHNLRLLKIFGLALILGSCFAWICLRCRDPRYRAEFLARKEERRNKKLYRRAARQHRLKMWFWNFRLKYGLAPSETLSWNEKRSRVLEQENILEGVMTSDIQALLDAQNHTSTAIAAEEGRNALIYDPEASGRRRSVATLPGYESEGSQPPTYDDIGGILEGTTVANGFRSVPADTEFNSDSSVISTSPRISRDGTNSDFDEKFEPIFLEARGPAGSGH